MGAIARRRVTYLIAIIIVVIAMIVSIVSVSTDSWITASVNGTIVQEGLWRMCVEGIQQGNLSCIQFNEGQE